MLHRGYNQKPSHKQPRSTCGAFFRGLAETGKLKAPSFTFRASGLKPRPTEEPFPN